MHCWHYGEGDLGNSCNMSLSLSWWISGYLLQIWRSMSLGGAYPLPLMSKGENEAEACKVEVARMRLPSSPKGEIVGIMLSGMTVCYRCCT